jgi:hypothetical protein
MDAAIHEVAWYVIKQKRWHNKTAVLPSSNINGVTNNKNIALFLELCERL